MKYSRLIIAFIVAATATVLGIVTHVQTAYSNRITTPDAALRADAAIVLGASVLSNGNPSDALRDRLLVGIGLYKEKNVKRILLTGDDGSFHADEIDVMKTFAMEHGVPENDILTDGHGYRTYESCKRATQVFHLKDVIVVTQRFHMSRALYICNQLGLNAVGVTSDLQRYKKETTFWIRDLLASAKAWWDIHVLEPDSPV